MSLACRVSRAHLKPQKQGSERWLGQDSNRLASRRRPGSWPGYVRYRCRRCRASGLSLPSCWGRSHNEGVLSSRSDQWCPTQGILQQVGLLTLGLARLVFRQKDFRHHVMILSLLEMALVVPAFWPHRACWTTTALDARRSSPLQINCDMSTALASYLGQLLSPLTGRC